MNIFFILALLFAFFFSSCSSSQKIYVEVETILSDKKIKYNKVEYIISQNIVDSIYYKYFSAFVDKQGHSCLLVLNDLAKHLEVYNLVTKEKTIKLPYSKFLDKQKFGEVNSVYAHNLDSIFIAQEYLISMIDTSKIILSRNINKSRNGGTPFYFLKNLESSPLHYDTTLKSLISPVYCSGCFFHEKKFYNSPIEASVDLDKKSIIYDSMTYSKKYLDNYYGFVNESRRTIYKEFSFFSFGADPNIYIYNRKNHELVVKGGRSSYHKTEIEVVSLKYKNDNEKRIRHLTESPQYHKVMYDVHKDLYYRFFYQEIPLKNEDGTYNSWPDKTLVLMVFDSDFKLLEELDLGTGISNPYRSFVEKEGLYIARAGDDFYTLKFDIFNFSYL